MFKDKIFYKTMLKIAFPIALQNLITSSINVTDVFMIGKLGEKSLAALGLANQIMFLLILFLFGINGGGTIFMAQFWGKKDIKNMHKVLGIVLSASIILSSIFFILTQFIPELLIRAYSPDTEVIKIGASYLKIVGWSYIITSISFVFSIQLRSIEKTNISVFSSTFCLIINVTLNFILIFGKFGFPAFGVAGAAIATSIARTFECIFIVSFTYLKKYPLAASLKNMFSFDFNFIKKFSVTSIPVLFNEAGWALGVTTYSMIYGRMGTHSLAAINIAGSIERILFVSLIGIASSAGVMIGNKIGENQNDTAFTYAVRFSYLSIFIGLLLSFLILMIIDPILSTYNISEEVFNSTKYIIIILAFVLPFKGFNTTNIVGTLRAGGDTKFCLALDISALWLIGIPFAYAGAFIFHYPIYIVFIFASMEEVLKLSFVIKRVISKKWIRNLVHEM